MMKVFNSISDPEIVERLQNGQVGVIPSDSIYGLMCVAANPQSVKRLYELKHWENKPGTLIGASIDQLAELGLDRQSLEIASRYWPGPVSVVVPWDEKLDYLHLGKQGLAVRIPDVPALQAILQQTGVLQTSSANLTGQAAANTIAEAQNYFGDEVDFYIDGGDLSNRQATTLIRIVNGHVEVLRQGAQQVVS